MTPVQQTSARLCGPGRTNSNAGTGLLATRAQGFSIVYHKPAQPAQRPTGYTG